MVLKMSLYVPVNVPVKEHDGKMSVKKWLVVGKMMLKMVLKVVLNNNWMGLKRNLNQK